MAIAANQGVTPIAADREVAGAAQDSRAPALTELATAASTVGSTTGLVLIALLCTAVAVWRFRRWEPVAFLAAPLVAAPLLNHLIKDAVARSRPEETYRVVETSGHSFPSAHAMNTTAVVGVAAVLLCRTVARRAFRVVAFSLALGLITWVGVSRVYLGAHWLTDVIAGIAIGSLCVVALMWSFNRVMPVKSFGSRTDTESRTAPATSWP